jgi:hypothetical protein
MHVEYITLRQYIRLCDDVLIYSLGSAFRFRYRHVGQTENSSTIPTTYNTPLSENPSYKQLLSDYPSR